MADRDSVFYKRLLDNIADGVYFVDAERRITFWNRAAERLTGYSAKEVVGKSCADDILCHVDADGNSLCRGDCPLAKTLRDGQEREDLVYLHHKDGRRMPVNVRVGAMVDAEGRGEGALEVFSDRRGSRSELAELERLRRETLTDSLTGVGNRRFTESALASRIAAADAAGSGLGLVFGDVDRFKLVNDRFGHAAGDAVLAAVARTLAENVRSGDEVGRWGGEEFLVILPDADADTVGRIAERLRMLVASTWVDTAAGRVEPTISLGAAFRRRGEDAAGLVRRADAAMYEAKAAGRNRVQFSL
jgi:diguanylate cyclase (GGDEF)-like protein/PAS domain S-box-containing protein